MSHRPEEPPYFVRKMDDDFQKRWHAADLPTRERLEDEAYAEWDRKLGPPSSTPVMQGENREQEEAADASEAQPKNRDEGEAGFDG